MKNRNLVRRIAIYTSLLMMPISALADTDPFTNTGNHLKTILFGSFGTTLCAIIIGATFIMAKFGKIGWERFLFVAFCTAGFLGAPSIVLLIKGFL